MRMGDFMTEAFDWVSSVRKLQILMSRTRVMRMGDFMTETFDGIHASRIRIMRIDETKQSDPFRGTLCHHPPHPPTHGFPLNTSRTLKLPLLGNGFQGNIAECSKTHI